MCLCNVLLLSSIYNSNPNEPTPVSFTWPEYEITKQAYISLDRDMVELPDNHFLDAAPRHFWSEVIPGHFNEEPVDICESIPWFLRRLLHCA